MSNTDPNDLSLGYVESLFDAFLLNPNSVSTDWQVYFNNLPQDLASGHARTIPQFSSVNTESDYICNPAALKDRVDQMVRAYRVRGHLFAKIDPLERPIKGNIADLEPVFFGITETELEQSVSVISLQGNPSLPLRMVLEKMQHTYCRSIGVQFMHIDNPTVRYWLTNRMESTENHCDISHDQQINILTRLTNAVILEEFIHYCPKCFS